MYAIVDIETTGGYAANNDITELAIVLHDGQKIVDKYQSLIRTDREIPRYIQVLTGITPAMLRTAPRFSEIAPKVYELLKDKVFVAHNVNFDFSFIKHNLEACGFDLDVSKLCTVRLTRKVFPGLPSYSLGNLCRQLDVPITQRHRAGCGDGCGACGHGAGACANVENAERATSRKQAGVDGDGGRRRIRHGDRGAFVSCDERV